MLVDRLNGIKESGFEKVYSRDDLVEMAERFVQLGYLGRIPSYLASAQHPGLRVNVLRSQEINPAAALVTRAESCVMRWNGSYRDKAAKVRTWLEDEGALYLGVQNAGNTYGGHLPKIVGYSTLFALDDEHRGDVLAEDLRKFAIPTSRGCETDSAQSLFWHQAAIVLPLALADLDLTSESYLLVSNQRAGNVEGVQELSPLKKHGSSSVFFKRNRAFYYGDPDYSSPQYLPVASLFSPSLEK